LTKYHDKKITAMKQRN